MTDSEERAKYYEQKAAEARARSEAIADFQARQDMVLVAQMWELMARNAKRHL